MVRAAAILLLLPTQLFAACPGVTQREMNQCAGAEFEAADADLNAVWRVVKPRMDEIGAGASLLDAQRKWIAFRDAACASEADVYSGGSIAPLVAASCLARLTTRRTQDLREMMLP